MGCDIHAMVEGKFHWKHDPEGEGMWISCGRIRIDREYSLFAVLGNVRNYEGLAFIGDCRFDNNHPRTCEDWYNVCSEDFYVLCKNWAEDGHSHSWVTLDELQSADAEYAEQAKKMVAAAGLNPEEGRLVFFFDN